MSVEAAAGATLAAPPQTAARSAVPPVVKRNARLLTAAEAFVGTGQQMVPTLGALMVIHLTNSPALAGIASSIMGVTRVLASYPSGRVADAKGRKYVLVIGLLIALVGALILGSSMLVQSFAVFVLGALLFGIGNGTSQQQRRLSAADMYPSERRAQGLGYVLTGSLVGALGGPVIISVAGTIAQAGGIDQMALSWLLVPFVLIPSLGLILRIHPDPKQIALALEHYWPGYQAPPRSARPDLKVTMLTFARNYPHVVAFVSMFVLYGNMSMMMALTPMTMTAHGVGLAAISMTVSLHVVGMYGLSMPIGKLADRFGRRPVMFTGILLSTAGTVLVALSGTYPLEVLGLYLVGLGWSCGNITTAAVVADTTPAQYRGRAMGANTSFAAGASVAAPLLGGVLVQLWGFTSLVAVTLVFVVPVALLLLRLREVKPGVFAHATTF